ncbi:hypothetical protein BJX96DRAFT_163378 [Aspergillus floccosus]
MKAGLTPFGYELPPDIRLHNELSPSIASFTRSLPPLPQARALFDHFVCCLQPSFGVLHVPSTRALLEQIYQSILDSEELNPAGLALLFSIFAGAALAWTPQLLDTLHSNNEEAKASLNAYVHTVLLIVDTKLQNSSPSTLALQAITTLSHVLSHMDGFSDKLNMLRIRTLLMARSVQLHRLDTARKRDERRANGCNPIEVEVQRRIWWHMVSSDWLLSLTGGANEGAYLVQPKHMNVKYPSNVDDESIPASGTPHELPLTVPTSITAFIFRIRLAELCREVVDTMPSLLLESPELSAHDVDYDLILALDAKFQTLLSEMPIFFKLDPTSIQQSMGICRERPYIPWQRIFLHFGIHTRICRLHRLFHLEGLTNPKYAYSRATCIRSAETVLSLRRSMDNAGALINLKPSRFWMVVQHVFLAAIILATDVSLNPNAPEAEARKIEVLEACDMLEKSQNESHTLRNAIQKNTQTLMMILQNQPSSTNRPPPPLDVTANEQTTLSRDNVAGKGPAIVESTATSPIADTNNIQSRSIDGEAWKWSNVLHSQPAEPETWGQLWSDMFNAGLAVDMPQWNSLLDDITFTEFTELSS